MILLRCITDRKLRLPSAKFEITILARVPGLADALVQRSFDIIGKVPGDIGEANIGEAGMRQAKAWFQ